MFTTQRQQEDLLAYQVCHRREQPESCHTRHDNRCLRFRCTAWTNRPHRLRDMTTIGVPFTTPSTTTPAQGRATREVRTGASTPSGSARPRQPSGLHSPRPTGTTRATATTFPSFLTITTFRKDQTTARTRGRLSPLHRSQSTESRSEQIGNRKWLGKLLIFLKRQKLKLLFALKINK